MKILHVVRQFHPAVGGIERLTLDLCRYLRAQGHECSVLTLNRDFASGNLLPASEVVAGIPVRRLPFLGPKRYRLAPATLANLGGCDLIHIHAVDSFVDYLALTRFLHRRPIVLSTHGGFFHSPWGSGLKRLYFRTATRLALSQVDRVVCDSPQDLALFTTIAPRKCQLIENGIDYDSFAQVHKRLRRGLIVYVGRTDANKRLDKLIEAFAVVARARPEARLALVGPDWLGEWPRLRQIADASAVAERVAFVGRVSDEQLRDWLAEAHFFASASVYEGFGIATVEAMATGTVPVLNDIPAFRHLTDDGRCGLLVDFDDPAAAGRAIVDALAMPTSRYEDLSAKVKQAASAYGWQVVGQKFLAVYRDVLAA